MNTFTHKSLIIGAMLAAAALVLPSCGGKEKIEPCRTESVVADIDPTESPTAVS
jgi:hypothetical protein